MIRLAVLAIGYVFGLFQTAYIYGKAKGIDIRQHGSGNAGTTNSLRVLGPKAGVIVMLGDIFKCVFAVTLTRLLFGKSHADMIYLLMIYAAAGVVLGHNFPFYLNFKGGKGIAATAGLVFSFHPYLILIEVLLFLGTFFTTHFVSLASILAYTGFFIQVLVFGQMGVFGMSQAYLNEMYVIVFLMTAMAYWRHKENIGRLIRGEERKTYLSKKSKEALQ